MAMMTDAYFLAGFLAIVGAAWIVLR